MSDYEFVMHVQRHVNLNLLSSVHKPTLQFCSPQNSNLSYKSRTSSIQCATAYTGVPFPRKRVISIATSAKPVAADSFLVRLRVVDICKFMPNFGFTCCFSVFISVRRNNYYYCYIIISSLPSGLVRMANLHWVFIRQFQKSVSVISPSFYYTTCFNTQVHWISRYVAVLHLLALL